MGFAELVGGPAARDGDRSRCGEQCASELFAVECGYAMLAGVAVVIGEKFPTLIRAEKRLREACPVDLLLGEGQFDTPPMPASMTGWSIWRASVSRVCSMRRS
jgi:hypothetical protein